MQNKMPEREIHVYSTREVAERAAIRNRKVKYLNVSRITLPDVLRIKQRLLLWGRDEKDDRVRTSNLKEYVLGVQNCEDLIVLIATNDSLIKDLHINDEELRDSLLRTANYKLALYVERVGSIMKNNPHFFRRKLVRTANLFGVYQQLKNDLEATSSQLSIK